MMPARTLFVATLLATPLAAQADVALDEIFPADSLFVLQVDDLAGLTESLGETAYGRLWAEPVFDDWRAVWELEKEHIADNTVDKSGADVVALAEQLQGDVGFGLFRMADWVGDADDASQHHGLGVSFGIAARITGDVLDVMDGVDAIAASFAEDNGYAFKTDDYEDAEIALLVHPDLPSLETSYAFVDDWFLFAATDTETIGDEPLLTMIDGVLGLSDEVLADNDGFAGSVAGKPAGLRAYGDLWSLLERLMASVPEAELDELFAMRSALPDDATYEMAAALDAGAPGIDLVLEFFGSALETESGGADFTTFMLDQDARAADWMPPETLIAMVAQLDAGAYYDAILDDLSESDPPTAVELVTAMADAEEEFGFHPRDDLLELLDGQLGLFFAEVPEGEGLPGFGEMPTGVGLLLSLTDGEGFTRLLDGLVRSQGFHAARRRETFEGADLYMIPIPPFVNIAYAVVGEVFVISSSPSLAQDVVRRVVHDDLPALSDGEAWQARAARLPPERGMGLHIDTGYMLRSIASDLRDEQAWMADADEEDLVWASWPWLLDVEIPDDTLLDEYVSGPLLVNFGWSDAGQTMTLSVITP